VTRERHRADAISYGDPRHTSYLLGIAACGVILGLLMWAGWIFWQLPTTLARVAFVGLLAFVALASAYVARSARIETTSEPAISARDEDQPEGRSTG
jgi:hypothetical protein